ncbi:hypothetical protein MNEG_0898 [Monoraphidium neglectum]|uniref:Uncharacterized protein n=1 Tax=Monoraphidium neglectum TaxID=145388 RepID=A0A0D2K9U7_9CHLO|nr:hypothetical protein MNEG_0898 [Monoraphidium neglectum]KIZ07048.1 hypothetical protein MNEG_0898 [Monoraphidium neglectum]|eukprot:XP_013906067.1 hypothetical protein MNEG_0898 [Monoraphidium neglectum]
MTAPIRAALRTAQIKGGLRPGRPSPEPVAEGGRGAAQQAGAGAEPRMRVVMGGDEVGRTEEAAGQMSDLAKRALHQEMSED